MEAGFVCRIVQGANPDFPAAIGEALAGSVVMAVAMMVPASLPATRYVAANSLKSRRPTSVLLFLVAYVTVWAIPAAAISAIAIVIAPRAESVAGVMRVRGLPLALGLASVWQITPMKRMAMRACHYGPMLPVLGWRAAAACLDFGSRYALRCMASCWLLMVAAYAAGGGALPLMVGISVVIWLERSLPRSAALYRATAFSLGALAVTVVLV